MYEQSLNYISVKNRPRHFAKLPNMEDTFRQVNTRPHQLHWGDREIGITIAFTEYSLVAGLPQKVSRSPKKTPSLHVIITCYTKFKVQG